MAWVERSDLRTRRNKKYQDSAFPRRFALDATLAPLHYESIPDSGVFDSQVDFTPTRIDNASYDGWYVSSAAWNYFVGQFKTGNLIQDGAVGFGGRR
jgi:hypothetical protein